MARIIMYTGVCIVVINFFTLIYSVLNLFFKFDDSYFKGSRHNEEMFGKGNIVFLDLIDIFGQGLQLLQGILMVNATKQII